MFMIGLAAVAAVIRIPGVSALGGIGLSEDGFDDHEFEPPIEYLEVGEREDMLGGPAKEAGWYLHPECMIGCCKSEGPFPSREAAMEADRIRWEEFARNTTGSTTLTELEPF
jgi:hypothetical protein